MSKWPVLVVIVVLLVSTIAGVLFLWTPLAEDEYSRYPHDPFYVSFSADGNSILARYHSSSAFVQLFSRENNVPVWSHYYDGWIDLASMPADGSYIAVDDRHSAVRLFQMIDNTPIWTLEPGGFYGLQISSDGERVLVTSLLSFSLFRWSDNAILSSYSFPYGSTINASLLVNDNFIIVVRHDNLYLFDVGDDSPVLLYQASHGIPRLSVSADGNYIATGGWSDIYLLSRENGLLWSSWIPSATIGTVAISSDGNYIAADEGGTSYINSTYYPAGGPGGLHLFSKDGTSLWSYRTSTGWDGPASTSISSDGSYIAIGDMRKLYLFGNADNIPLWTYEFPEHISLESVSISADGNYIAVGTEGGPAPNIGGSVYLFDTDGNIVWSYFHEVEPYVYA